MQLFKGVYVLHEGGKPEESETAFLSQDLGSCIHDAAVGAHRTHSQPGLNHFQRVYATLSNCTRDPPYRQPLACDTCHPCHVMSWVVLYHNLCSASRSVDQSRSESLSGCERCLEQLPLTFYYQSVTYVTNVMSIGKFADSIDSASDTDGQR